MSDLSLEATPSNDGRSSMFMDDRKDKDGLSVDEPQVRRDEESGGSDAHFSYHEGRKIFENSSKHVAVDQEDLSSSGFLPQPHHPTMMGANGNGQGQGKKNRTLSSNARHTLPDAPLSKAEIVNKITDDSVRDKTPLYKMGMLSDDASQQILEDPSPELVDLYTKVQECRDLRTKYQSLSLQYNSQNPTNSQDWEIYPPPPKPSYNAETKTVIAVTNKPDAEVFDFNECEIPGEDTEWDFGTNDDDSYYVHKPGKEDEILANIPCLQEKSS